VTDLSGNVLWAYSDPGSASLNFIDGVKMLPDGNFLMVIGASSSAPLSGQLPAGTQNAGCAVEFTDGVDVSDEIGQFVAPCQFRLPVRSGRSAAGGQGC
jgi:hypothetical protein